MRRKRVKQDQVGHRLRAQLLEPDGSPMDLEGASVRFLMRAPGSSTLKVDGEAQVESAAEGRVAYVWQAADLDQPGRYEAEWEVVKGSAVIRVPSDGYLPIDVIPSVRGGSP